MPEIQALRSRRMSLRFTGEQVARKAGISLTYLRELEVGMKTNPTLSVVTRIREALDRLEQERAEKPGDRQQHSAA
ncbi:MAG TPA: helix-turn-helix domain-containing protein [Bryobacteraceae bacterium]|nr:helix-turn-helix domain-containing protein [Bryobacteraceae bacterium]